MLRIRIEERATPRDFDPRRDGTARMWYPRWVFEQTGNLTVRLSYPGSGRHRTSWSDGKRHCVEDYLEDIVRGSLAVKSIIADWVKERQEQQRQWEEEHRIAQEHRRRAAVEKKRVELLDECLLLHHRIAAARELIAALPEAPSGNSQKWREWIQRYLERAEGSLDEWPDFETLGLRSWELDSLSR